MRQVVNIAIAENHAADPRFKSEQNFWDVYNGDDDDFYKEYRMKKPTFADCVPFLYDTPSTSEESIRHRLIRSKVVMAILIRFLATQLHQHNLGKEFGVRRSTISKRIRKAYRALLTAYYWTDYPDPKITFPTTAAQRNDASSWFFNKTLFILSKLYL
jgi:predicted XRE-type DNA-binding protein